MFQLVSDLTSNFLRFNNLRYASNVILPSPDARKSNTSVKIKSVEMGRPLKQATLKRKHTHGLLTTNNTKTSQINLNYPVL